MEGGGGAHRVLAGQGVGHQQGLGRGGDAGDLGRLAHHGLVQGGAAGGVEDHHIIAAEPGGREGAPGDVGGGLALDDRQGVDLGQFGQHRQLLHGGRPAGVERGDHHLLALGLGEPQGQLGDRRGLARALQARDHHHHRRIGGEVQVFRLIAAQHLHQAVEHDLDHLVGGLDRADDVLAGGALLGLGDELPHHRQGDVGLQQGHAHLAQRLVDVRLRQHATAGQPVEDACQPLAKGLEHPPLQSTKRHEPPCAITRTGGLSALVRILPNMGPGSWR